MHALFAAQANDPTIEPRLDPHRYHAAELHRHRPGLRRSARYAAARALTRLSLAAAAAVRALDACVADDLSRRLAMSDGR
jgi:hypothetical protein